MHTFEGQSYVKNIQENTNHEAFTNPYVSVISLQPCQSNEKHLVHDQVHVCNNSTKFEHVRIRTYRETKLSFALFQH